MKTIIPHLWFDKEAKEAAGFYTSITPNSKVTHISRVRNTPSGDCDLVSFELAGQPFMAISAGPYFKCNPSISFHIKCKTTDEVDAIWKKMVEGGKVLMELGEYPFSKRYGWLEDKYGVSWQIIYAGEHPFTQTITPVLTYVGKVSGKTDEAVKFYTSVFSGKDGDLSKINMAQKYGANEKPEKEGTIKYTSFMLHGMEFGAMDSAREHNFAFNEAISLIIPCENQEEIDYFWGKMSADPKAEQCGWLKDKYGVSWQVWPVAIGEMMESGEQEKIDRLTQAFLPMKKFDIAALKKAYEGSL